MRYFFGRRKPAEEESDSQALDVPAIIMQQKEAIATLEKKSQHLEVRIAGQLEEAKKKSKANDKLGAMHALKRKQILEKELERVNNARLTLDEKIIQLEGTVTTGQAIDALKAGVNAQKRLNERMNVDKIESLMDDIQDQQDLTNEVHQALTPGINVNDDVDLLQELEQLQLDDLDSVLQQAPQIEGDLVPGVPAVLPLQKAVASPTAAVAASTDEATPKLATTDNEVNSDEEQLKRLQAELASL